MSAIDEVRNMQNPPSEQPPFPKWEITALRDGLLIEHSIIDHDDLAKAKRIYLTTSQDIVATFKQILAELSDYEAKKARNTFRVVAGGKPATPNNVTPIS